MGATRVPVITNPGNDPGRNQAPARDTDSLDVRGGGYHDSESMVRNPGGSATTRCKFDYVDKGNGPAPRDRGNRAIP